MGAQLSLEDSRAVEFLLRQDVDIQFRRERAKGDLACGMRIGDDATEHWIFGPSLASCVEQLKEKLGLKRPKPRRFDPNKMRERMLRNATLQAAE